MNEILVPVSPADLIDRLTRLHLRSRHMNGCGNHAFILRQIAQLEQAADHALPALDTLRGLWSDLADANADIFALDADLRNFIERSDFGTGFVALSRAIFAAQDGRNRIKQQIDQLVLQAGVPVSGRAH